MVRCVVALPVLLVSSSALGAEASADEISRRSRERGTLNLVGLRAETRLVTVSKDGKSKEQVLTSASRKVSGATRSISRFSAPTAVAGVAVLTIESPDGEAADIALYLPKLKRVRKVAKSERGKSFMDTDFSYSDLGGMGTKDSDFKRLEDQKVDGRDAYVLRASGAEGAPYGQVTAFVDKETYVPLRVEYQDPAGKPFKLFRSLKLRRFKDRTLSTESTMENLQTGSKTTLMVTKLEEVELSDEDFSERALERG